MYRITKLFQGYPFAHRQHTHDGHCKLVHGHNWDFEICLSSTVLDENGFVYDFGKFKWLKTWLEVAFDHTCVISEDDPELEAFQNLDKLGFLDLKIVPSCSAEGLAKYVFQAIQAEIPKNINIEWVRVYEDHKNHATYSRGN